MVVQKKLFLVFACIAVFFLLFQPVCSASGWWDSDWENRKQVTITENSGSDLSNYQVPIDLTNATYNNTGLVGSWHFSEGTGVKAVDSSGSGNTGTLINNPIWTTGKFGSGLQFDNTANSHVEINDSSDLSVLDAVTIEAWVEATDIGSPESSNPVSCLDILNRGESTGDGVYFIDPDGTEGNPAFRFIAT